MTTRTVTHQGDGTSEHAELYPKGLERAAEFVARAAETIRRGGAPCPDRAHVLDLAAKSFRNLADGLRSHLRELRALARPRPAETMRSWRREPGFNVLFCCGWDHEVGEALAGGFVLSVEPTFEEALVIAQRDIREATEALEPWQQRLGEWQMYVTGPDNRALAVVQLLAGEAVSLAM